MRVGNLPIFIKPYLSTLRRYATKLVDFWIVIGHAGLIFKPPFVKACKLVGENRRLLQPGATCL